MALHLRSIHTLHHERADVRCSMMRQEQTTEQLRDELADRFPIYWKRPNRITNSTNPEN